MVLGVTSVGNAALQPLINDVAVTNLSPSTTVDVAGSELGLYTTSAVIAYDVKYLITSGTVAFDSSGILFPLTFDFAGKIVSEDSTHIRIGGSQFMTAATGPGDLATDIGLSGLGLIEVYDTYSSPFLIGTLNLIPEPMTIVLLGLGGLFLRRRK